MFKTLEAKIVGGVILVLLIAVGVFAFLWQSEKVLTVKAKNDLVSLQKEHSDALAGAAAKINELNTNNAELSRKAEEDLNKAHQEHKAAINEILIQHRADLATNERLRNTITTLNNKVSNLSDAAKTQYAITAGNNLAECSAFTAEVVKLARDYSAELDFVLAAWPKTIPVEESK
jgi:hypothetical protein